MKLFKITTLGVRPIQNILLVSENEYNARLLTIEKIGNIDFRIDEIKLNEEKIILNYNSN